MNIKSKLLYSLLKNNLLSFWNNWPWFSRSEVSNEKREICQVQRSFIKYINTGMQSILLSMKWLNSSGFPAKVISTLHLWCVPVASIEWLASRCYCLNAIALSAQTFSRTPWPVQVTAGYCWRKMMTHITENSAETIKTVKSITHCWLSNLP